MRCPHCANKMFECEPDVKFMSADEIKDYDAGLWTIFSCSACGRLKYGEGRSNAKSNPLFNLLACLLTG